MSGHGDEILREFQTNKGTYKYFEKCVSDHARRYLEKHNVEGDGHCFFHAVIRCIAEALPRMSPECVDAAKRVIGARALMEFLRNPAHLGTASDVRDLRSVVSKYMHENAETEGCQASSTQGLVSSMDNEGVDPRGYSDVDCPYAQAVCNAIGIGVAIEVPVYTDAPKTWIFSQPEAEALSLSHLLQAGADEAYRDIRQKGTKTAVVRCTDVIYLSLDGNHFQSYVYKARVDDGIRSGTAESLQQEIAEEERERRERERREDEKQRDKDARLAWETHDGEVARVEQVDEDIRGARLLAEQERKRTPFGATRPQRNRAFVSHVLRAARSTRFRY